MPDAPERSPSAVRRIVVSSLAAAALAASACAPMRSPGQATAPRATRKQERAEAAEREAAARALQAETFDHAWQRIADTYPYEDFRGLDWQAVHDELRPRAERCRTAAELRPVLQQMLARLGESHFQVLPGEGAASQAVATPGGAPAVEAEPAAEPPSQRGDIGLELRRLGSEFVVTRVDPTGPAAAAGMRMGWTVLSIGDTHAGDVLRRLAGSKEEDLTDYLGWAYMNAAMRGEPGSAVVVRATEPGQALRSLTLTRRDPPGEVTRLGNLTDLVAEVESKRLDGNVGYIRMSMFLTTVAQPFTQAMREFVADGASGVVIDIRGNPGGVGGLVMGLAGHFVREQGKSLGTMKTRQAELRFVANPRGPGAQFDGPVAVLVDGLSLSTSELFAGGLQKLGRARVFGQQTGGMALPSIVESLPNGDRLQFAVADLTGPDGERIEGAGIRPDVAVPLRKEDLVAGRDAVLDSALEWISLQATHAPAHGG